MNPTHVKAIERKLDEGLMDQENDELYNYTEMICYLIAQFDLSRDEAEEIFEDYECERLDDYKERIEKFYFGL